MVCRLTGNINVGDEQSGDNWSVKCSKTNYQHEEEQEVAGLHEKQRKFGFGLIVAMREIQTLDLQEITFVIQNQNNLKIVCVTIL